MRRFVPVLAVLIASTAAAAPSPRVTLTKLAQRRQRAGRTGGRCHALLALECGGKRTIALVTP